MRHESLHIQLHIYNNKLPQKKRVSFQPRPSLSIHTHEANVITRAQAKKQQGESDTALPQDQPAPVHLLPSATDMSPNVTTLSTEHEDKEDSITTYIHSPFSKQELITAQHEDEYCKDLILLLTEEVLRYPQQRHAAAEWCTEKMIMSLKMTSYITFGCLCPANMPVNSVSSCLPHFNKPLSNMCTPMISLHIWADTKQWDYFETSSFLKAYTTR